MGYKFQFITLAGFHALNYGMFELARQYRDEGMSAYVRLQEAEFAGEAVGYTATKHQREVGTGYFDAVVQTLSGGQATTSALSGSTEEEQFAASGRKCTPRGPESRRLDAAASIDISITPNA